MIAASRLAEVDRELEAFGVDDAKVEAVLKAVRALSLSAEDIEAFLSGTADVEIAFERPSSEAIAVDVEEDVDALEAAAPSQEIELDEDVIMPPSAPAVVQAAALDDDDSDFPMDGTELAQLPNEASPQPAHEEPSQPAARELELEFDGDLLSGNEPLQFEAPVTESVRPPPRPSRAPLSQADLDAELAAILADPDDRASDSRELGARSSLIDVEVEMAAEDSSDAVDVTDVADVTEAESDAADASEDEFNDPGPTVSTRPPPLPTRPPSMAPGAPESGPGFLGRLLNRK